MMTERLCLMSFNFDGPWCWEKWIHCALAFYLVSKQGIRGYNVDIVATSKEQALTSFMDVHDVLEEYKRE